MAWDNIDLDIPAITNEQNWGRFITHGKLNSHHSKFIEPSVGLIQMNRYSSKCDLVFFFFLFSSCFSPVNIVLEPSPKQQNTDLFIAEIARDDKSTKLGHGANRVNNLSVILAQNMEMQPVCMYLNMPYLHFGEFSNHHRARSNFLPVLLIV